MVQSTNQVSEADLAYRLLQQNGRGIYYRDLIMQALQGTGRRIYSMAPAIAEVHTQINMDSRFVHEGKGIWGLAEWMLPNNRQTTEDTDVVSITKETRRSKLFEEIQQQYIEADSEASENE